MKSEVIQGVVINKTGSWWRERSLCKLNSGEVVLTATQIGAGVVLVSEKGDAKYEVGFIFDIRYTKIKKEDVQGWIQYPVIIKFFPDE